MTKTSLRTLHEADTGSARTWWVRANVVEREHPARQIESEIEGRRINVQGSSDLALAGTVRQKPAGHHDGVHRARPMYAFAEKRTLVLTNPVRGI